MMRITITKCKLFFDPYRRYTQVMLQKKSHGPPFPTSVVFTWMSVFLIMPHPGTDVCGGGGGILYCVPKHTLSHWGKFCKLREGRKL